MGELQVGEEICDAIVARPRDETIAVAEKEIEPLSGGKKYASCKRIALNT